MAATLTGALGTGLLLPNTASSAVDAPDTTSATAAVAAVADLAAVADEAQQQRAFRASRSLRRAAPVAAPTARPKKKVVKHAATKAKPVKRTTTKVTRATHRKATVKTHSATRRVVVAKRHTKPASKPTSRRGVSARVASLNWSGLARCESGGNPRAVNPSGKYLGLYQFDVRTWRSVGGSGSPTSASRSEQTYRAQLLYTERGGSGAWPVCGRHL